MPDNPVGQLSSNDLTGWNFAGQNLTNANFGDARLTDADLSQANLRDADFTVQIEVNEDDVILVRDLSRANLSEANLTNANLELATLTDADLTDAIVNGTSFRDTTSHGFTKEQLYSTASYKMRDLTGILLRNNDLSGWEFFGQNLINANFEDATLTDADLTDAVIAGADFEDTTLTEEQLYSTASYKQKELTGINLEDNNMPGWNFVGQNLANSDIEQATLTEADLNHANVVDANLSYVTLSSADLSFADLRGAVVAGAVGLSLADTSNTILPDGLVSGLDLGTDERLVIRDHELPVKVEESMTFAESATLELVFADAAWGSTMGIGPGVIANLGGTLALNFDADANIVDLVGVTFGLFDWNGQLSPDQRFDQVATVPGHMWDLSQLYTTGHVQLLGIPEPSGVALVGVALLIFGVWPRRKNVG